MLRAHVETVDRQSADGEVLYAGFKHFQATYRQDANRQRADRSRADRDGSDGECANRCAAYFDFSDRGFRFCQGVLVSMRLFRFWVRTY